MRSREVSAVMPRCPSRHTDGDLIIEGARQHNLKNLSFRIPHNAVTVVTGVSGSGKSSLAFDTLFAEGQWRYVESLSTYARMFLDRVDRPDVDRLVNIRPAIAIEQKNPVRTARSTVATATEIADLLRLLFAKIGWPTCPDCKEDARGYAPGTVADELLGRFPGARVRILFPLTIAERERGDVLVRSLLTKGYARVMSGEQTIELEHGRPLPVEPGANLHVLLDRVQLRSQDRGRLVEAVETAFREGDGLCRVDVIEQGRRIFSMDPRCPRCGRTFDPVRPVMLSFNHPLGACPVCKGFGNILRYDEALVIPDRNRSLAEGVVEPWTKPGTDWWQKQMLLAMRRRGVNVTAPYASLSKRDRTLLWQGDGWFKGIHQFFEYLEQKRYKLHVRVFLSRYRSPFSCTACGGTRLRPEALLVKVDGWTVHQVSELTIREFAQWLEKMSLSAFEARVAEDLLKQLTRKAGFLLRVGLGYLTLSRQTRTLSGGEAQRIALANQLGSRLVGTLYVLDEPTIGLHARDTATLAAILRDLAAAGNTVVAVEHDRQVMEAADYIVELGPRSGEQGGELLYAGPRESFLETGASPTVRYLRGENCIPVPTARRHGNGRALIIAGVREHNLKSLTVKIPLRMLVCVTGVSGSGKSTLVRDTVYRAVARAFRVESLPIGRFTAIKGLDHLRGVSLIDQAPIGRTPRSNPITYIKAFDEVRAIFAAQSEARRRRLTPLHFSFNTPAGRCERCQGNGYEKLEMYFFEDLYVTCENCNGQRFRPDVLAVRYRDKTIHDVLSLTVSDALAFFSGATRLVEKLRVLATIGLGYLRLGQPATTLSGGEAQRLKIAAELAGQAGARLRSRQPSTGDCLYILDEPTTGLHAEDIKKLLAVLGNLVEAGNTALVVEHNLEVIKTADWIIDLGPEGGEEGGQIVAEGRPEQIAAVPTSHTGRALYPLLPQAR